jgi:DNA-binding Lrp family transcriptional regulator
MDGIDRAILNRINKSIPLCARPFREIAEDLHLSEEDLVERIRALKKAGFIRRIGAVIDPKKLGWSSTLCAADIPEDRLEKFASLADGITGITHNYVREGHPNCWFTVIAPGRDALERIIKEIEQALDITVLNLPACNVFKIRVAFDLD